jgi:tetratricopeptide (TPR) repeat protein
MSPIDVARAPSDTTSPLAVARRAFEERRFDDASLAAARALAQGASPEAFALRAAALLAASRPGPALAALSRAPAATPGASVIPRLRALAFADLGRALDAADAAEEAVRLAPDDPWAHEALARGYALARRSAEARTAALRAVALAPAVADLRCALGELYAGGHPAVAEGHLRAAIALDPSSARPWLALGDILDRAGRGEDAASARARAAALDPALAAERRGPAAVAPLLVTGAAIFLTVLAFGLLPAVARMLAPGAVGYATGLALAAVTLLPTAFLAATAVRLRRARRAAPAADPALAAAVRDAARPAGGRGQTAG